MQAVVRRAWYAAYTGIYSRAEMNAVFAGLSDQEGSWIGRRARALGTLVAELDGVIVGIASCALLAGGDGELVGFYVLPEVWGQGVGGALWDRAVEEFLARGCVHLWVWCLARSRRACDMYRRRGCAEVERGSYALGAHVETALGLRLNLHPSA